MLASKFFALVIALASGVLIAGEADARDVAARSHDYQEWEKTVREEMGTHLAGGYAYALLDQGKIVASGVEGFARAPREKTDGGVRWTLDKPMGLASVSKTITAVAVMNLWEETGRSFSLDDPFWQHIKRVVPDCGAEGRKITIRQLLRHRSGLPHVAALGDVTTPQRLEKLLKEPLAHKPGDEYSYDNNNFYILRLVIEEISHYSYTAYVKKNVLKPMGIEDMETHFEHDRPMCGYTTVGEKRPGFQFDWDATPWAGAAGWYGSVDDLGRFLNGLHRHTVLSEEATKILLSENMGWDRGFPHGKGGDWIWDIPDVAVGSFHSAILLGQDGVDGVLLMNCNYATKHPEEVLVDAWTSSLKKKVGK